MLIVNLLTTFVNISYLLYQDTTFLPACDLSITKPANLMPIKFSFNTWGEEIYFTIPVSAELDETAREEVETGALGYWPAGKAFRFKEVMLENGVILEASKTVET